jgi:hypothetical protein
MRNATLMLKSLPSRKPHLLVDMGSMMVNDIKPTDIASKGIGKNHVV